MKAGFRDILDEVARVQLQGPTLTDADIKKSMSRLYEICEDIPKPQRRAHLDVVNDLRDSLLNEHQNLRANRVPSGEPIPPISETAKPGISLVTCSMNRSENLLKALQSWLPHDNISEIIIVDWGSDTPVQHSLDDEGIVDPRIRIIRAPDETRWVLSYAFNLGFRFARFDKVLKVDADIVLSSQFFDENRLHEGQFIAGNWREVEEEQKHVNGFFFVHKSNLAQIGGFNEFITTYGWDDDDLYERLGSSGLVRRNVSGGSIFHLDHSDSERSEDMQPTSGACSAITDIKNRTLYKVRRNRFIASVMPVWTHGQGCTPLPMLHRMFDAGITLAFRAADATSGVSSRIEEDADFHAMAEIASWEINPRIQSLDRTPLVDLLSKPLADITKLHVELAHSTKPDVLREDMDFLVIHVDDKELVDPSAKESGAFFQFVRDVKRAGWQPVIKLRLPFELDCTSSDLRDFPILEAGQEIGLLDAISMDALRDRKNTARRGDKCITLARDLFANPSPLTSPQVSVPKRKVYIDAQHGLGNRLRAIGSAAAVADSVDRELVIVWQPDSHCEGKFSDIFAYDGAVEERSLSDRSSTQRTQVYNYMEIEDGAEKDAPIIIDPHRDLYVRSAYVLNTPLAGWEDENRFIQELTPVAEVRALIDRVRTPNDVSAHVRMVGGSGFEHLEYESLDHWSEESHAETGKWRKRSHYSHFLKRIDTLIETGDADRIFLAADKPETYVAFQEVYGDRVAYLERHLYDRSVEQLQYALADAILLGSSPLLLGSTWSSFTELAMRLSKTKMKNEMSGRDF